MIFFCSVLLRKTGFLLFLSYEEEVAIYFQFNLVRWSVQSFAMISTCYIRNALSR